MSRPPAYLIPPKSLGRFWIYERDAALARCGQSEIFIRIRAKGTRTVALCCIFSGSDDPQSLGFPKPPGSYQKYEQWFQIKGLRQERRSTISISGGQANAVRYVPLFQTGRVTSKGDTTLTPTTTFSQRGVAPFERTPFSSTSGGHSYGVVEVATYKKEGARRWATFRASTTLLSQRGALAVVVGDSPETPHQTRDNRDLPPRMRQGEARLRPACPYGEC